MGLPLAKPYVSHADYIAMEEASPTKHEWLDGVMYDTARGTPDHAALASAVQTQLGVQLRNKRCRDPLADPS